MFSRVAKPLTRLIYPTRCFVCKKLIISDECICEECKQKIEPILVKTCLKCGLPLKNCECYRFIYHFSGIVSPFENRDAMQQGIYHLKFSGHLDAAELYANAMAECVRKKFDDISFDFICAIPMHPFDRAARGFNQAELLAKAVSNKLNSSRYVCALKKHSKTPPQHSLNTEKRFSNVRNLYAVRKPDMVCDKTILLIDDIKTTGATLDECARQLLLCGAARVYCATALITLPLEKKEP